MWIVGFWVGFKEIWVVPESGILLDFKIIVGILDFILDRYGKSKI